MHSTELYFGDFGSSDVGLPIDIWIKAQRDLAAAEVVFRSLAREHKLRFRSNLSGRVAWPARRLEAGGWFLPGPEVRLMLNPKYMEDTAWHDELRAEHCVGGARLLARLSADETADRHLIRRLVESAIAGLR